MHAIIIDNTPHPITGPDFRDAAGTLHSASILRLWPPEDLAAIGVHQVVDDDVPAGQVATGQSLELDEGTVRRVWVLEDAPDADLVEQAREAINAERDRRFYSDLMATFPSGAAAVQLRDERDRSNFANVVQGAMILVAAGQGSTEMSYITGDNVIQSVPASDMVQIGITVMAAKQAIVTAARQKKDALAGMTRAELLALDVTAGWPE